jgi:hypothetical protein
MFEQTVEDHWFASIASVVRLELDDKSVIAKSVQELTEKLMVYSNARLPSVINSWTLMERIFRQKKINPNSGFSSILTSVFRDQLRQLYLEEQTQAVAILSTIGMQIGLVPSKDAKFFHSIKLGIHDHANLFQRLGNWKNARIMDKMTAFAETSFPELKMVPETILFQTSSALKNKQIICCICDFQVRGLLELCIACGHGGHMNHMTSYFRFSNKCPYPNCDCDCRQRI